MHSDSLLFLVILFLHVLGFASMFAGVLGGLMSPEPKKIPIQAMIGLIVQAATGVGLAFLSEPHASYTKMGIKMSVVFVLLAMDIYYRTKNVPPSKQVLKAYLLLVILQAGFGVFLR